jgi:hypothetical protein
MPLAMPRIIPQTLKNQALLILNHFWRSHKIQVQRP